MTPLCDRPGDGAESQPDPAGCAGRNAGEWRISSLDSSWSLFRPEKIPVAEGERLRVTGKIPGLRISGGDRLPGGIRQRGRDDGCCAGAG